MTYTLPREPDVYKALRCRGTRIEPWPHATRTYIYPHNRLTVHCPRLPEWAGTRRNSHLLTAILIIRNPLSTSSIYHDPCSVYVLDSPFHNLCPGPLWYSSWSGTLYFILHARVTFGKISSDDF